MVRNDIRISSREPLAQDFKIISYEQKAPIPIDRDKWLRLWSPGGAYFNNNHGFSSDYQPYGEWVNGKEIRVFREPSVARPCLEATVEGLCEMVDELGLKLDVLDYDIEASVQPMIDASTEYGVLDGEQLSRRLFAESYRDTNKGGKQHADVLLTSKPLRLGDENWGETRFNTGAMIMSLPQGRQGSYDFIGNVAKHEAAHLLGFQEHHARVGNVIGYAEPEDCLTNWQCSTRDICERDEDALLAFWLGIEQKTGQQYLKR